MQEQRQRGNREEMSVLNYNIIGSGSSGNAVRIENIMFDAGLPFSEMEEDLYKCDALILTHIHSDHIKPQTLNHILKAFPRIKVYGNPSVAYKYPVNEVIGTLPFSVKGDIEITPFPAVHDVENTGFMIKLNDMDILYITDTAEVNIPKDAKFDWFFIESNYDEVKLREVGKKYERGSYNPLDSQYRHLSTQQAKGVYYTHRKSKESQFIELHKSRRFY